MKKIIALMVLTLVFLPSCSKEANRLPTDNQPMYGKHSRSPEKVKADEDFVDQAVKESGSKEAALQKILKEAWEYQRRGYLELAMTRFNQAWLINPDCSDVFHGFAVLLYLQGKIHEAEAMYKKALELDPKNALALCRLGRLYQDKALALSSGFLSKDNKQATELFDQALQSYERSSRLTEKPEDLSYIYYQWAIALAVKRDYTGAWEKVHLSRKAGGEFIEENFIRQLSQDMPDPELLPHKS